MVLAKEGQEAIDSFLNPMQPISKEEWKRKIFYILSLLMNKQGCKQAGKELVIEAIRIALPKSYDPMLHQIEDPMKFKRLSIDPFQDMEAYYELPIQVKRWEALPSKPTKRPDEMRVIAFCASPRKQGNTSALIDEALRGAQDAGARGEKFMIQKIKPKFCIACRRCSEPGFDGFCVQKDGMSDIYPKIVDSDAIIIGFPIYLGRECAQLAAFLDRWSCLGGGKLGSGKRALVIGTWGYPYVDTYDFVIETIIGILHAHRVTTVEAISACGFEGLLHGWDENRKAIILSYPKEVEKAYQAGKGLVT